MANELPRGVKKVLVVKGDQIEVWGERPRRKKRRTSKLLRPAEKLVRRSAEAGEAWSGTYLDRHGDAARKKKNGWLKKMPKNVYKANRKGLKKLRKLTDL